MRIEVLLFGPAAQAAGSDRIGVECEVDSGDSGPRVPAVLAAIAAQHPRLAFAVDGARLAVNHAFAAADASIGRDDEVALVSLVGGG
jgi:molybdopterin converting factor small subunit